MKRRILSYQQNQHDAEGMEVDIIQQPEMPILSYTTDMEKMVQEITPQSTQLVERNKTPCGSQLVERTSGGPQASGQLIRLAKEIAQDDSIIHARLESKLGLIRDQMQLLREEALITLQDAKECLRLNHLACNFSKVPGHCYHVYKRPSGQEYLSMLSPQEWKGSPPHEFVASYRLERDHTWTKIKN